MLRDDALRGGSAAGMSTLTERVGLYSPLVALEVHPLTSSETRLRLQLPLKESDVRLDVCAEEECFSLWAQGEDEDTRKLLRNVLVGRSQLYGTHGELHHLEDLKHSRLHTLLGVIAGWAREIKSGVESHRAVMRGEKSSQSQGAVLGYWWDSRANFGDAAGPWLLRQMAGREVINARRSQSEGRAVASIGSLCQMLERHNVDIWGSGLLYEPDAKQLKRLSRLQGVMVHAVRGPLTRGVLRQTLDWDVPEVYGDPALLFPRYFTPHKKSQDGALAVLPHRQHRGLVEEAWGDRVSVLNVADDVRNVVTQIASSEVCISTSLHGLIFAQAYGVPWLWLNVHDQQLKGGDFKFDDFFSTLEGDIARVDVGTEELPHLDIERLAEKARLPATAVDLTDLERAFPLERGGLPDSPVQFDWSAVPGEERLAAYAKVFHRRQRNLRDALAGTVKERFSGSTSAPRLRS